MVAAVVSSGAVVSSVVSSGSVCGGVVAGYAKEAMDWAVTNGVLSGKGAAGADISTFRLDPTGTATRAECAAMLKNFMTAFGL